MTDLVPLREYVEAVIHEQTRALEMASAEREKAAHVLRENLAHAIAQGDTALTQHVQQEIERIREALRSADALEVERIEKVRALIDSVRRQLELTHDASERAIAKAEKATEERFHSMNEFRAQLADQTASFLPREVAERQFDEITKWQENATKDRQEKLPREVFDRTLTEWTAWRTRVDVHIAASAGRAEANRRAQDRNSVSTGQIIAGISASIALLGILAAILVGAFT